MIFITLTYLLNGCVKETEPVVVKALFCDVEEQRRFSQEEIDWRAEHAPWNLKRDYRTNLTWDRECRTDLEK